jgi:Fanconi anemia group M protein
MPETKYVSHPLIRANSIVKRLYQETIFGTAVRWNTLVVLPTGVGKTILAVLASAYRLHASPQSKCVILAPTKPLVVQHQKTFREFMTLSPEKLTLLTGEVTPIKRQKIWDETQIAFMTPQVLQNDLLSNRYTLDQVSLLVFDEAHRAIGDYAYVYIARQYSKTAQFPLILALTASPGSEIEKIREIIANLHIQNIELRTRDSPDVAPYLPPVQFEWCEVELPDKFKEAGRALKSAVRNRLRILKDAEIIESSNPASVSIRAILDIQRQIQQRIGSETSPPSILFQLVSHCAALIRLYHGIEQLETQGVTATARYFDNLVREAGRGRASKAIKGLVDDPHVQEAVQIIQELSLLKIEHPKLKSIVTLVSKQLERNTASRIMIFTRFRGTAQLIEATLKANPEIRPIRFIGQASRNGDRGLTQKEQVQILQAFRDGTYNTLVATSVGEEGLDIQECDLVIFYEAVPSAIRLIQRRGRTGRTHPGRVIVLVALGTRDQGYYWSAIRREAQMKEMLKEMQKMSRDIARDRKQVTLKDFTKKEETKSAPPSAQSGVLIVVDSRELRSKLAKSLHELGVQFQVETLEVGDYLLSDRVGVEAKTSNDFAQSIVDKRLFSQLQALQESFELPLLMIIGSSLFGTSGVRPEALCGALASSFLDFHVPVLMAQNESEAASLLFAIARREQIQEKRPISIRGQKPSMSLSALQRYIVAGLPGVNTTLAKRLLDKFGSISAIVAAPLSELETVHGIGKTKARVIREALDTPYQEET